MSNIYVTVNICNQTNDIAGFHMTLSYKILCLVYRFMFLFNAPTLCIQVLYGFCHRQVFEP